MATENSTNTDEDLKRQQGANGYKSLVQNPDGSVSWTDNAGRSGTETNPQTIGRMMGIQGAVGKGPAVTENMLTGESQYDKAHGTQFDLPEGYQFDDSGNVIPTQQSWIEKYWPILATAGIAAAPLAIGALAGGGTAAAAGGGLGEAGGAASLGSVGTVVPSIGSAAVPAATAAGGGSSLLGSLGSSMTTMQKMQALAQLLKGVQQGNAANKGNELTAAQNMAHLAQGQEGIDISREQENRASLNDAWKNVLHSSAALNSKGYQPATLAGGFKAPYLGIASKDPLSADPNVANAARALGSQAGARMQQTSGLLPVPGSAVPNLSQMAQPSVWQRIMDVAIPAMGAYSGLGGFGANGASNIIQGSNAEDIIGGLSGSDLSDEDIMSMFGG